MLQYKKYFISLRQFKYVWKDLNERLKSNQLFKAWNISGARQLNEAGLECVIFICGGGKLARLLSVYSDDLSSNPAEANSVKIENNENRTG